VPITCNQIGLLTNIGLSQLDPSQAFWSAFRTIADWESSATDRLWAAGDIDDKARAGIVLAGPRGSMVLALQNGARVPVIPTMRLKLGS
jgi:hypothetical protein